MLVYTIAVVSVVTFLVWGFDKFRAIMNQWRVPERWLVILTVAGGSFGALAGMVLFWHKIRKPGFWLLIGMCCPIHILIIFFLK